LDQPIVVILVLAGLFIVTLVWLFFLISGRRSFKFNVKAFGVDVRLDATTKGGINEQHSNEHHARKEH
jgi:hypothetical protein